MHVPGLAVWAAQVERKSEPWEPHTVGQPVHHQEVLGFTTGRPRPRLWRGVQAAAQRQAQHRPAQPGPAGTVFGVADKEIRVNIFFQNTNTIQSILWVRKGENQHVIAVLKIFLSLRLSDPATCCSATLLFVMFVSHKPLKIEVVNDQPTHFLLNTPPSHPLPKTKMLSSLALTSILFRTQPVIIEAEKKGIAIIFI